MQLKAPDIAATARPGQFVMVHCGPDTTLRRPLSIHFIQDDGCINILFACATKFHNIFPPPFFRETEKTTINGIGTSWLAQRKPGETVSILGPLGNGYNVTQESRNLLLIAGGIGIAPLLFLAKNAIKYDKQVTLLIGAKVKEQLYPLALLPEKSQNIMVTENGSAGRKGMVSDIFTDFMWQSDQVFACGPLLMYQSIFNIMKEKSIEKPVQVSLETRMGCGVGACYGCSINMIKGMKMICQDGPVFNIEDVIWEELKI